MRTLAMTAGRRAQYARIARTRFDRHEAELGPAVKRAIDQYLGLLRAKLDSAAGERLVAAAAPQLGDKPVDKFTDEHAEALAEFLDESDEWQPILAAEIMPTYSRVLDEILQAGLNDPAISGDLVKWRNQWLADRTQVLVGVPDQITSQLRTALRDQAQLEGTSVYDARSAAQEMLDNGYPSWQGRADLIARTETVGANNQGSLASWSALAASSGATATKTWLATSDARTRPDHADADGQTVPIDDVFEVGGDSMNGPGDPDADPSNVCNCRCTMTYDFPNSEDTGDGGNEQTADGEPTDESGDVIDPEAGDPEALIASADTSANSGVAIMLGVGAGDEAAILSTEGIPAADPPGLHCTLGYLSEPAADYSDEQRAALVAALAGLGPEFTADILGLAHFNVADPEREPCVVLLVQSQALADLHEQVQQAITAAGLEASTTFPIWQPHVTLGYNLDPAVVPDSMASGELQFNRLVVGWGGQQVVAAGDGATNSPDPSGQTDPEQMTAATEASVTAPTEAPAPDPAPPAEAPADGATAVDLTPQGPTWSGVLAELDTPSSDGRIIASQGIVIRPLPLTLSWQKEYSHGSADDNDTVVAIGRILTAEVRGTQLWGSGDYFDPMMNYDAQQAMAIVESGTGTVSVDMAVLAQGWADADGSPIDPSLWDGEGDVNMVALESELGGCTIVPFPAFATARITNDPVDPAEVAEDSIMPMPLVPGAFDTATPVPPTISDDGSMVTLPDGTQAKVGDPCGYDDGEGSTAVGTLSAIDAEAQTVTVTPAPADGEQPADMTVPVAALQSVPANPDPTAEDGPGADDAMQALLASSEVRPYTAAYFKRRDLAGPTPLTVVPETGEVYGHLATWGECHVGKLAQDGVCQTAPHSLTDYGDFHLSPILTDEGSLYIGKITVGTGHALPGGGFSGAVAHYDNTGTAVAVVRAHEDDYGIQVTGQIIHDTLPAKVEELMRSPLSGDWRARQVKGGPLPGGKNLELCAALAVNTPGFPVRPAVAGFARSKAVGQLSLVAAGVVAPRAEQPEHIVLPSGVSITTGDMDALVAAAQAALTRHQRPAVATEAQALALRAARARLALVSD